MDVALMSHVKNHAIGFCVIDPVDRNRQLNSPQIGGEMSSGPGHIFHKKGSNFAAKQRQLFRQKRRQILRIVDRFKYTHWIFLYRLTCDFFFIQNILSNIHLYFNIKRNERQRSRKNETRRTLNFCGFCHFRCE